MLKFLLLKNLLVTISVDELSFCWFQPSFLHVAFNSSGPGLRTTLSRARLLPLKLLRSLLVRDIIATSVFTIVNFWLCLADGWANVPFDLHANLREASELFQLRQPEDDPFSQAAELEHRQLT